MPSATETANIPDNKQSRAQIILNEKEFNLRLLQLVFKQDDEKPVVGRKEKIGYESLQELAKNAGVEISELPLSMLSDKVDENCQFCTSDGEVISRKTLARYVKQVPENMNALGLGSEANENIHDITIVVYYLTTEEPKNDFLEKLDTKADAEAIANGLHGKSELKSHNFIDLPKARATETAELIKEMNGESTSRTAAAKDLDPTDMNLAQWRSVFKSLQLLHGDFVRAEDNTIFKATKSAFRIQSKNHSQGEKDKENNVEKIPNFLESHETSITFAEITSNLQKSLASTGFTSASLSVAIGASAKVWSASAGLGVDVKKSESSASSAEKFKRELRGYWNAPQVEVMMDKNNMVLDPECKAALDMIIENGTYENVVDFYKDYGTIFAQMVVLGGRLITSKDIATDSSAGSSSSQSEIQASMEASINVSLFAKGSVKGSLGTGSSAGQQSSSTASSTGLSWNAQGGDTTLAKSPEMWLPTVKNFKTWFPIKKEKVISMDDMISGFPGYEMIPTIFAEIIASKIAEDAQSTVPWTPEMFKDVKDSKKLAGLAIDSYTGRLKQSPFQPLEWHRISHPTQGANPDPAFCWKVFNVIEEVKKEVTIGLKDNTGLDSQINVAIIPPYLYSLQASERSLSVMMKWTSAPREHSMASPLLKLASDAALNISKNGSAFFDKHGDRFVCGWIEQSTVIAVWTIEGPKRGGEFNDLTAKVSTFFRKPRSLQDGCDFFTKGCEVEHFADKYKCVADVYKSSAEAQAVVLTKGRVHPSKVIDMIEHLVDEDYIPTSVKLKSYRTVYPRYKFSPPSYSMGPLKKVRDLFQRNVILHIKSKASPFQKDSAPERELDSQIKDLRNEFEQKWYSCVMDKAGQSMIRSFEDKYSKCEDKISMRFFARDWLRAAMWAEDHDISTTNSNPTSWNRIMGLLEPHASTYEPHVIQEVKNQLVYFEDKKSWDFNLFQSHDNKRYFGINQSHKYYLVGYYMDNLWGNETNGTWWIEQGDRHAVARRNPRVAHRKVDLRGYSWILRSLWLPKESFPFINEELME